jgi:hypothetical protein
MANPNPTGTVLTLILVAAVALLGIWGLGVVVADVGETTTVTTTVDQQTSYQPVGGPDDADRYLTPTRVENQTRNLTAGEYDFNESDGTIRFNETVQSGDPDETYEQVNVTVAAVDMPGQSAALLGVLRPLFAIPTWLLLILGPVTVLASLWYLATISDPGYRGPA